MPSPNGYFDCAPATQIDRNWFQFHLTHDVNSPPWNNTTAAAFNFEFNIGTAVGGPFTPINRTTAGNECTNLPGNQQSISSATTTIAGIGGPASLLANTDYFVQVILFDDNNVEVDRDVCGPIHTEPYPTFACLNPGQTQTTGNVGLGLTGGTVNTIAPCNQDTVIFERSTTAGGPYTADPSQPATGSPAHTFTGLTPATMYFWRARLSEQAQTMGQYLATQECSFTTDAVVIPPVTPPAFQPLPCEAGAGAGESSDVEGEMVCDVDAAGNVVGMALVEAVYDSAGMRTGTRLVNVTDGTVYVPQGTIQPCPEGCCPEPVVLCDVQPDNSAITFVRTYTGQTDGGVTVTDQLLDGSVYVPTGTVGSCDPYTTCTPSPNIDLAGDCGPGETPNLQLIADDAGTAPDSTVNDDPSADPLCGGQWARAAQPENAPFPVNETFRNATFDQAPAVTQGTAPYFQLTAPSIDPAGQGWGRGSDVNSFTNGMWQIPNPFPASPGATVEITVAMHDGTATGGDGWVFAFTDGSVPPQAIAIGGGGSLGLGNWQGGYVGIVLDSYGGTGGGSESISIQGIGPLVGNIVATSPVNPKKFNATTRAQPLRLRTSIITQFGQTYVSASIDWNDGNGFVQYFDRVNVTPALGAAPATLRMGTNASSGGAYRDIKEQRDAVAHAAGIEQWRAFPITTDPIPACVTLVTIRACVDLTFTSDTQTTGNSEPDAWLWLVNDATNTVLARTTRTSTPNQVGTTNNICVETDVNPTDIPNLRVYVGADTRDASGAYSTLWENFTVTATGAGCPATPVRTLAISAPCPIPVTIVGGGGDGGGGGTTIFNAPSTFEDAPVCMTIAGSSVPGFRREVRAADGSTDVRFLGDDGLTVTPDAWTPGGCSTRDTEIIELCDVQAGGAVVPFLRVFTYDENGDVTSVENQDANGNPYIPAGTTTVCSLIVTESYILCDQGNASHQFLHYIVRAGGALAAVVNTELDGLTPYAPVGPVGVCSPPPDPTDPFGATEEVMCDTGADPQVSFIRRTTLTSEGDVLAVTTTLADGTAYVPVGPLEFGACDECCPVVVGTGCADEGAGVFTTSSLRMGDGTIQILSQGDGHVVNPNDVVACTDPTTPPVTLQTRVFNVVPGSPWTPALVTGTLTALSVTGVSGTYSITPPEGPAVAAIPAGFTAEWGAEDANTLDPPTVVNADAASRVIATWTER